jgi:hypothetical protein
MNKNIFDELKSKLHDEDFEPRAKCEPTAARPGSLEKLFVLAQRVERGQPLYHPFDECILATVAMEFEKAKHINRLYKESIAARQQARRAKHA